MRAPLLELQRDLRYALRGFGRAPGFTAVAVLTLTLGIGANSAIFSVVNGVLLQPLPYTAPERLVVIHSQFPTLGFDEFWISPPEYRGLQDRLESVDAIGGWRAGAVNVAAEGEPVRVTSSLATAELFGALGVAPYLGRPFTPEEDRAGEPVVVISHGLWRTAFGADSSLVGGEIQVDGGARTVVGVMPPGFDLGDNGIDVWVPAGIQDSPSNWSSHFLNLVARLQADVPLERARAELATVVSGWGEESADHHVPRPEVHELVMKPLQEAAVGGVRTALVLLLGAVGFVLLIACANVANLLLARAEVRQREVAVRMAMGAGRGRLIRQFLTESLVLGLAGGVAGLLFGWGALRLLLTTAPDSLPRLSEITLDGTVVGFTLGLSVLTGVLFGLAPLLHLTSRSTSNALKEGGLRATAGRRRTRLRRLLVVAEVALAVVLVVGSGLMLRTLGSLQDVEPGFEAERLLTFQVFPPAGRYADGRAINAFYRDLIDRLEALPGVESAAAMSGLPPLRDVAANDTEFEDYEPGGPGDPRENVDYYQTVQGDYFEVMGIPIVAGRAFQPSDEREDGRTAIINERLASVFFRDLDPIGRRIMPPFANDWFTVVGIAGDVKQGGISAPTGTELYFFNPQFAAGYNFAQRTMNMVVRSTGSPLALAGAVRRTVADIDPALPLANLRSMEQNLANSITRPRFISLLLTAFAALALALAAVGTYGVMAYSVAERSHEFGIRMAMGARSGRVLRMVLGRGLATAAAGILVGTGAALGVTRVMESLLFGVQPRDTATFLVAPAVLLVVAAAACWLPARRATRVEPANVLRQE